MQLDTVTKSLNSNNCKLSLLVLDYMSITKNINSNNITPITMLMK